MTSFLIVIAVAVALSWVASRVEFGGLDPIVIGMGGAIIAGGLAAALFADEIAPTLAAAFAAAVALVAGRNFGTLVRAGGFFLVGPVPGSLAYLDGVLPAAGAFWIVLQILA